MSREDADLLLARRLDTLAPDEADADAVWVALDVPEAYLLPFERSVDAALGYREFEVPGTAVAMYKLRRIR